MKVERLEEELLALPRSVREHLAEVLTSSLDERELAATWDTEADRRFNDYRDGRVSAIPAEEGLAAIRANLGL